MLADRASFLALCEAACGHARAGRINAAECALFGAALAANGNPWIDLDLFLEHAARVVRREKARS